MYGSTGPTGPEEIGVVYFATFNDKDTDGYIVESNNRIPISRKEVDNTELCTLYPDNTIGFNKEGVYRVDFIITTYNSSNPDFDEDDDVVAVGFKKVNEQIVYAGGSSWFGNEPNTKIIGQGMFIIKNTESELMELINMSKHSINLNTPSIGNTTSQSYFINPLVTILIQYLG